MTSDHADPENTPEAGAEKTNSDKPMLTPLEARILGALMEKQLTTPDVYPLTLNSLQLACNQKTSREPVMNLNEGAIQHCLYSLRDRKLVDFDYGSRATKFSQRLARTLHFDKPEQAIFCIMLLRGPQTINELFSRTKRMFEFASESDLERLIEKLLGKYTPLIVKMPPQSGQREYRYMHLLCGQPEATMTTASTAHTPAVNTAEPEASESLVARVEALEKQVAWLMETLKGNE